ncbi:MAG: hypothetical protein WCD76_08875, partial [Pyrinomonadaceae bacterium]
LTMHAGYSNKSIPRNLKVTGSPRHQTRSPFRLPPPPASTLRPHAEAAACPHVEVAQIASAVATPSLEEQGTVLGWRALRRNASALEQQQREQTSSRRVS